MEESNHYVEKAERRVCQMVLPGAPVYTLLMVGSEPFIRIILTITTKHKPAIIVLRTNNFFMVLLL
jgi:hypothetical protein